MSLVCSPGRRAGEGVTYVVVLQPMSCLLFKRQASCFWHQEHVPQFCCWKQCPGNSVPYYLAILLSLCSTFLLVLTHTHFHSDFRHANLNISYKSLLRKQTKVHFSWANPFSIKTILDLWNHIPLVLLLCGGFSKAATSKIKTEVTIQIKKTHAIVSAGKSQLIEYHRKPT